MRIVQALTAGALLWPRPACTSWSSRMFSCHRRLLLALSWLVAATTMRRQYLGQLRRSVVPALADDRSTLELDLASAELVVEHLGSDDPLVVLAAMNTLERRGHARLIPSLVLRHPDGQVLRRALEIFGAGPSTRGDWHTLADQLIEHADDRVRFAAASALAAQGKLDFERLASDSAPGVRGYVALHTAVLGPLANLVDDPRIAEALRDSGARPHGAPCRGRRRRALASGVERAARDRRPRERSVLRGLGRAPVAGRDPTGRRRDDPAAHRAADALGRARGDPHRPRRARRACVRAGRRGPRGREPSPPPAHALATNTRSLRNASDCREAPWLRRARARRSRALQGPPRARPPSDRLSNPGRSRSHRALRAREPRHLLRAARCPRRPGRGAAPAPARSIEHVPPARRPPRRQAPAVARARLSTAQDRAPERGPAPRLSGVHRGGQASARRQPESSSTRSSGGGPTDAPRGSSGSSRTTCRRPPRRTARRRSSGSRHPAPRSRRCRRRSPTPTSRSPRSPRSTRLGAPRGLGREGPQRPSLGPAARGIFQDPLPAR